MSNYPPGVTSKDFDDPEMSEWVADDCEDQPDHCIDCGDVNVLDEEGVCQNCFEPKPIEKDEDDYGD